MVSLSLLHSRRSGADLTGVTDLPVGGLALNLADGKLFTRDQGNNVVELLAGNVDRLPRVGLVRFAQYGVRAGQPASLIAAASQAMRGHSHVNKITILNINGTGVPTEANGYDSSVYPEVAYIFKSSHNISGRKPSGVSYGNDLILADDFTLVLSSEIVYGDIDIRLQDQSCLEFDGSGTRFGTNSQVAAVRDPSVQFINQLLIAPQATFMFHLDYQDKVDFYSKDTIVNKGKMACLNNANFGSTGFLGMTGDNPTAPLLVNSGWFYSAFSRNKISTNSTNRSNEIICGDGSITASHKGLWINSPIFKNDTKQQAPISLASPATLKVNKKTINPVVTITQADYDALGTKDPNLMYIITGP